MSEEDIEKLESVLSTEEAKKVLETALTTANTPSADPEGEDPGSFIINEDEAKKILEVGKWWLNLVDRTLHLPLRQGRYWVCHKS